MAGPTDELRQASSDSNSAATRLSARRTAEAALTRVERFAIEKARRSQAWFRPNGEGQARSARVRAAILVPALIAAPRQTVVSNRHLI
jgi:hypothetical protein